MTQLVVEYLGLHYDSRTGNYVKVLHDRHPHVLATVFDRVLTLSTEHGEAVGGYAESVWRRYWYEERADKPDVIVSGATEDSE